MHLREVPADEAAVRRYTEVLWLTYKRDLETVVEDFALADDLMGRAAEHAREVGCEEVALDVDADNERAIAFYEKLGFETARHRMRVAVDGL